ncbi:hypothetical protein HHK36_017019 [Tetracentron sinense]|uniref:ELMO domain-containing protein n=1 Tax=Tetracentron sinense TaxID=13715 RepID=A0A834Z4F6_TETSI|nr:hypothetical protein HHK36_017019 [Tetracentron sinense]
MTSRTLRRRLHHGDVDVDVKRHEHLETSGLDGLNEPLLGNRGDDDDREGYTLEDNWDDERRKERIHWTRLFSNLLAQWAQWLANIVLGSGSFLGRLVSRSSTTYNGQDNIPLSLSPLQEERLRNLQQRLEVPFDGSRVEHQDALKQLWRLAYPNRELPSLKSELWKEMGWQGPDPSTDFRGGGFISLENLIFFSKSYPVCSPLSFTCFVFNSLISIEISDRGTKVENSFAWNQVLALWFLRSMRNANDWEFESLSIFFVSLERDSFQRLLHKQEGRRAEWEYPFAVAGINISFMLAQMLDLKSGRPNSLAGIRFLELLRADEMAFDNLYCVAFQMMDAQWLAKRASYMEFNDVLKSTRTQLERELALEDLSSVRDLPAYNLLNR